MRKLMFLFLVPFILSSWNLSAQSFDYGEAPKSKIQFILNPHLGWMPYSYWALPLNMDGPDGKVEIRRRKNSKKFFPLKNFTTSDFNLGVKGIIRHPQSRLGGFVFLDYRNRGFEMKYPGEEEFRTHIAQSVSPAAGLRLSIGRMTNKVKGVLEAGAAYNLNFKYKGSYDNDLKAVNNGFSGIYGIGIEFASGRFEDKDITSSGNISRSVQSTKDFYWTMTLQYRQDYYNFFNNDFTHGGVKPYQGFKSNFGYLGFSVAIRGTFNAMWSY